MRRPFVRDILSLTCHPNMPFLYFMLNKWLNTHSFTENETRMKRIQFRRAVCLLCKSNGNRIILFMRTQNVAIYVNSRRGGETKLKNVSVYRQTFITHSKRSCIWSILSNCATYLAVTFCSCRTHRRYFKLFIDNFIDCSRTNAAFDDREEIS